MAKLTRNEKKRVQEQLIEAGFALEGYGVDGKIGTETRSAIKAFEEASGLKADGGRLNDETIAKLFSDGKDDPTTELKKGSKGVDVIATQQMLKELAAREGNKALAPQGVDGVFGSKTQAAVVAFQEAKGIEATGTLNEKTREALVAAYNEQAEVEQAVAQEAEVKPAAVVVGKQEVPTVVEQSAALPAPVKEAKIPVVTPKVEIKPKPVKLPDALQTQAMLRQVGYDTGAFDGKDGTATQGALKKFQTDKNLEATGAMNIDTAIKMTSVLEQAQREQFAAVKGMAEKTLTFGSTGQDAATWNSYLVAQNYLDPADISKEPNRIGNASFEATKAWQSDHSIGTDGKVGPQSRRTAVADLAKPLHEQVLAASPVDYQSASASQKRYPPLLLNGKPPTGADRDWLIRIAHDEAKGESIIGQQAVIENVIARANNDGRWEYGHVDTPKEVIFDKKWAVQYEPAGDNRITSLRNVPNREQLGAVIDDLAAGRRPQVIDGALFFAAKGAETKHHKKQGHVATIGNHHFYGTRQGSDPAVSSAGLREVVKVGNPTITDAGNPIKMAEVMSSAELVASTVELDKGRFEAQQADSKNPVTDNEVSATATPVTGTGKEIERENVRG